MSVMNYKGDKHKKRKGILVKNVKKLGWENGLKKSMKIVSNDIEEDDLG